MSVLLISANYLLMWPRPQRAHAIQTQIIWGKSWQLLTPPYQLDKTHQVEQESWTLPLAALWGIIATIVLILEQFTSEVLVVSFWGAANQADVVSYLFFVVITWMIVWMMNERHRRARAVVYSCTARISHSHKHDMLQTKYEYLDKISLISFGWIIKFLL